MLAELYHVCKFCLFDAAYLAYAVLVFGVSVAASREALASANPVPAELGRQPPMPGGELRYPLPKNPPKPSVVSDFFSYLLDLASFSYFLRIMRSGIQFIRTIFLLTDNPSPLRSFWRYFNIYYLVIVLPAAFMPPVLHPQRPPDFHLLAAVVLLICVNAAGDVISVRAILRIFRRFEGPALDNARRDSQWDNLKGEISYYLAVLGGGAYSLAVLIGVLICSSILYGVQIGQMDFGLSQAFFQAVWDRIVRFPELAWTPYWFRDQPGPFGLPGIPGMLIYGMTTFLPIIILSCLAIIWLFLLPFRIAANLPPSTSPVVRVISSEVAVLAMCLVISLLVGRLLLS